MPPLPHVPDAPIPINDTVMRHRADARSLLLGGAETMSAGRKIKDEADPRACLKAAQSSGASRIAWARAHGIDGRSLYAWAMNLAKRGASAMLRPRFVELVPGPTSAPPLEERVREEAHSTANGRAVRVLRL